MDTSSEQKLTRFTTAEERENIVGVDLNDGDVEHFMDLFRMGLVSAAAAHEAAVQDDMGLSVEASVRISRPVRVDGGDVAEVVGRETVTGRIMARKVYIDEAKKPKTGD